MNRTLGSRLELRHHAFDDILSCLPVLSPPRHLNNKLVKRRLVENVSLMQVVQGLEVCLERRQGFFAFDLGNSC